MIRRYDYGTPLPTGAIVLPQPVCTDEMPRFTITRKDGAVSFQVSLGEDDQIFGLGESVRGINKRGHLYRAWCSDVFSHTEDKASLYASHNLVLFSGKSGVFGLYVDDPGAVTFDLGYTRGDEAVITSENGDCSAYYIEADSLIGAVKEFRHIIGRSYLPPKWGLGYIQSRWGYATEEDLREVVTNHRERHIPLDIMSMDIDYMEDFRDFTWDAKKFPDLPGMIASFKADHIRVMPIIDAGVKVAPGDPTYDEGMEKDYFVKKEDGSVFVGAVWPGHAVFPDFLRDEVRQWFGGKYHGMLEAGVEAGFACNGQLTIRPEEPVVIPPQRASTQGDVLLSAMAQLMIKRSLNFHTFLEELSAYQDMDILILSAYDSELIQEGVELLRARGNSVTLSLIGGGRNEEAV